MTQEATALSSTDGRLRRSAQSRQKIADALYELLGEGELEPSAQQVADRAGVGIRTVFRLFADMDALYATVDTRLERDAASILSGNRPEGASLAARTEALVAERAAIYERLRPYIRATIYFRHRSEFLTQNYRRLVLRLRQWLMVQLPELLDAPADLVEAMDQAVSFEAWDRLRVDQGLSRPRAKAVMLCAVGALVAQLGKKP